MARYYADNGRHRSEPEYEFLGWDEIGGEVVEATHAHHLGMRMERSLSEAFQALSPGGSRVTASGGVLERHW